MDLSLFLFFLLENVSEISGKDLSQPTYFVELLVISYFQW